MIYAPRPTRPSASYDWQLWSGQQFSKVEEVSCPFSMAIRQQRVMSETLNNFLLPILEENDRDDYVSQQDGAAIHTAYLTKHFLLLRNIRVICWLPHSPDLNPIENVWGLLARKVYANDCTFETKTELQGAIVQTWQQLEQNTIDTLVNSMQKRCISVILRKGQCISCFRVRINNFPGWS